MRLCTTNFASYARTTTVTPCSRPDSYAGLLFALAISNIRLFKEIFNSEPEPSSSVPSALSDAPTISLPLTPPVPLPELISVLGRIKNADDIGDWERYRNSLKEKLGPGKELTLKNSCRWVLREDFRETIRSRKGGKFVEWPTLSSGEPLGGADLKRSYEGWVAKAPSEISDATLDVVFNTWAGATDVSERPKVEATLSSFYKSDGFDLSGFQGAVLKSVIWRNTGVFTFLVVQVVLLKVFFYPAIIDFFEI